jgi:hypothetical protein
VVLAFLVAPARRAAADGDLMDGALADGADGDCLAMTDMTGSFDKWLIDKAELALGR